MKMLLIVFRQSMVEHIHALLKEYDVTAFTELHNVAGRGKTGPSVQFLLSPGANCMILTAVSEPLAYRLIDGFTRLKAERGKRQNDSNAFPLHVFILPCEQVV
jgi:nitrogen regulatory protein PII